MGFMPSKCLEEKLMCYKVFLFLLVFHVAGGHNRKVTISDKIQRLSYNNFVCANRKSVSYSVKLSDYSCNII
jgi:hypothetical protein